MSFEDLVGQYRRKEEEERLKEADQALARSSAPGELHRMLQDVVSALKAQRAVPMRVKEAKGLLGRTFVGYPLRATRMKGDTYRVQLISEDARLWNGTWSPDGPGRFSEYKYDEPLLSGQAASVFGMTLRAASDGHVYDAWQQSEVEVPHVRSDPRNQLARLVADYKGPLGRP